MNFCAVFKSLRKESGISALKLSQLVGYSKNIIYEWEKGRAEPNYETLVKLADFFDVSIDFLVGRSDDFDNVTVVSKAPNGSTPQEEELLKFFRGINANDKLSVLRVARSFYLEEQEKKEGKKLG